MKKAIILMFLFIVGAIFQPAYAIHPIKEEREKQITRRELRRERKAKKWISKWRSEANNNRNRSGNLFLLGLILLGVALLIGLLSLIISIFGLLGLIAKLFALAGVVLVVIGLVS